MPNYCSYKMRVYGKKENVDDFLDLMRNYDRPKHFWRVFEFDAVDDELTDETKITEVIGDCAWSVAVCMTKCKFSYAENDPEHSTSLQEESERLGLEIEVYSDESGMGFQEHYHYSKGQELANECLDCCTIYFDEEMVKALEDKEKNCQTEEERDKVFEEWKKKYHCDDENLERDFVEAGDEWKCGGYGSHDQWIFSF